MSPTTLNLPSVFSEDDFDLDVRELLDAERADDPGQAQTFTCTAYSIVICPYTSVCD
ncbi:hypothetical protein ACIQI7_15525 [Kitasatospora sp. NPDC092039]|uniref:hypothetical protein n=1 Tax=Kitasatospora sp. NPDC092039 TaxID=3364086 RepID=UPI0038145714